MGSVGDSQPIDTHVPPVCPLSHLDREDGGSMFLQIGEQTAQFHMMQEPPKQDQHEC